MQRLNDVTGAADDVEGCGKKLAFIIQCMDALGVSEALRLVGGVCGWGFSSGMAGTSKAEPRWPLHAARAMHVAASAEGLPRALRARRADSGQPPQLRQAPRGEGGQASKALRTHRRAFGGCEGWRAQLRSGRPQ